MNRRGFAGLCVALGSSLASAGTIMAALSHASARAAVPTVKLRDGAIVPALGQGSANLAQERRPEAAEEEALRTGLSLGMTLIDTAEMYGGGRSEKLIGRVIAGQRDRVFLVSKVWPNHVAGDGIARACEASLGRLGIDYLDLYLLHWPSREADLSSIVAAFESLRAAGKIRAWGVSNFKVTDMEDLFRVSHGDRCATNQVLYNLASRDIERDLLPWCEQHGMPIMPIRRSAAPAPACFVIPCLPVSALHIIARQPPWRWPGRSAAAMSLQFPNPVQRSMSGRTPSRSH